MLMGVKQRRIMSNNIFGRSTVFYDRPGYRVGSSNQETGFQLCPGPTALSGALKVVYRAFDIEEFNFDSCSYFIAVVNAAG